LKNKSIIVLFVYLLTLQSCKKYPEDKFISLRSPGKRLERFTWKIKEIRLDGNLINSKYNDSLHVGGIEMLEFTFTESEENGNNCSIVCPGNNSFHLYTNYSFGKDNKGFYFSEFGNSHDSLERIDEKILNNILRIKKSWTILKLYTSEFKIEKNGNYEVIFSGTK
jgi:hypothetical protein